MKSLKMVFLVVMLSLLISCDKSIKKEAVATGEPHLPQRVIMFDCANAPQEATLNQDLNDIAKSILSVNCKKGLGHTISAQKGFMWIYREMSYAGIRVPVAASLNAKVVNEISGDNFHDFYFTDISVSELDAVKVDKLLDLLREKNPGRNIKNRDVIKEITVKSNLGVTQKVYLLSSLTADQLADERVPELGFVCNPECGYEDIFYTREWVNRAEEDAKLRAKYAKD